MDRQLFHGERQHGIRAQVSCVSRRSHGGSKRGELPCGGIRCPPHKIRHFIDLGGRQHRTDERGRWLATVL